MKLLIGMTLILMCQGVQAQDSSFLKEGKRWNYVSSNGWFGSHIEFIVQGDTLIGGAYKKLYVATNESTPTYYCAMREKDGRVYRVNKGTNVEQLLFNTEAETGDLVYTEKYDDCEMYLTVTEIDECLILNKVDTKSSRIMVKKPNESSYVKSSNRINEMRLVYEMRHLQHLSVPEIMSKTGISHSQVYRFFSTFAREYPELADQMKKKRDEVTPDEYEKLLGELSTLKAELKREKLRADFYEEMVAFGKEVYGIDLKKAGTK